MKKYIMLSFVLVSSVLAGEEYSLFEEKIQKAINNKDGKTILESINPVDKRTCSTIQMVWESNNYMRLNSISDKNKIESALNECLMEQK